MKKINYLLVSALVATTLLSFSSCAKDDADDTPPQFALTFISSHEGAVIMSAFTDPEKTQSITNLTKITKDTKVYLSFKCVSIEESVDVVQGADIVGTDTTVTMTADKTITTACATKGEYFTAEGGVINSYTGSATVVVIPSTIDGVTITEIGTKAFEAKTSITSLTIPNTVTSIGDGAFFKCTSLTNVDMPNALESIGEGAFSTCSVLTSINIPNTVKTLGAAVFAGCTALTGVEIPSIVTSIPESVFENCKALTSITIPSSVTSIGMGAFFNCDGLTSITIPKSVTSIDYAVFASCNALTNITVDALNIKYCDEDGILFNKAKTTIIAYPCAKTATTYTIPASVTGIQFYAFSDCTKLTTVTIPSSTRTIGHYVFAGCTGLTDIPIHSAVTNIGEGIFAGCTGLTDITLPSSIVSIGADAFSECENLERVTMLPTTPPALGANVFYGTHINLRIKVPVANVDDYKVATRWSSYAGIIIASES